MTTAVMLTALLGFVGLGVDLGLAYSASRAAQNAADSAALTTATALDAAGANPPTNAQLQTDAQAIANQYGLSGATVAVTSPYNGDDTAVEVAVSLPGVRLFSSVFLSSVPNIRARAVARPVPSGQGCMLALDGAAAGAVTLNGTFTLNMPSCSLYDNSAGAPAMILNGGDVVNAAGVYVVGTALNNGAVVNAPGGVQTGAAAVQDPYSSMSPPTSSGCSATNEIVNSGSKTYTAGSSPFVFCGGLTVNSGAVNFAPGTYVFTGNLNVNNATQFSGSGVSFVFTGSAAPVFNSGTNINLSAPTSGAMAGMLFYGPNATSVNLNAASSWKFQGAFYFPKAHATFNSGADFSGSNCTQIITDTVILNGGLKLGITCTNSGMRAIGPASVKLVE